MRVPLSRMAGTDVRCTSLIDALCAFNKCKPHMLERMIKQNGQQNIDYIQTIFGDLRTRHLKNNIYINPHCFSTRGANHVYALGGYLGITVQQYFFTKHKIVLEYSNLPCIVVKGGLRNNGSSHYSYFPLECLEVCYNI
jgi:hypothetical protein